MKGEKILLVEDEESVLGLNTRRLKEEGYQMLAARPLKEARAFTWESPSDLVMFPCV